jgi:hypothetical protein
MEDDFLDEVGSTYPEYSDVGSPAPVSYSGVYDEPLNFIDTGTTPGTVTTESGSSVWGSVASDVGAVGGGLKSILQGIGSLLVGANSNSTPTAGVYNAAGQFVPLRNAAGVISTPGQTTVLGQTGVAGSSVIGSSLSGVFSSISPYLPILLIGAGVIFLFKLLKGK